jgi:glycosyltransferase involved in cell wall biosynthesis
MPKLSCVIPVFNEEGNILELYRRLKESVSRDFTGFEEEYIFVDDGSTDGSLERMRELHDQDRAVKIIEFSRNFGHHIAITAGLDHATGDYVVMMDSDLQDKPEEMIKLFRKLREGYDVVYGERANKKFPLMKRLSASVFIALLRYLVNEPIVMNSSIFRIMTRQVVENTRLLRERNRYIIGVVGWVGFKHAAQPVEHGERYAGESKYRFSHQIMLALNAALSYSTRALTLITRIGLLFVALALLLGIWIIYAKIMLGMPVTGWTSLLLAILAVGGIQIIMLGMIGAYIGRNYMEDKNRPLYIIRRLYD